MPTLSFSNLHRHFDVDVDESDRDDDAYKVSYKMFSLAYTQSYL